MSARLREEMSDLLLRWAAEDVGVTAPLANAEQVCDLCIALGSSLCNTESSCSTTDITTLETRH